MSKRASSLEQDLPDAKKTKMTTSNEAAANGAPAVEIDEDLHSRQLAVYGKESMRRMATANVLICGLGGLGVEVAKNVILAGVKSITLHDRAEVTLRDLASQFYLSKGDVGKNRAEACREAVQELNTSVPVAASSADLADDFLAQFQVVVATDTLLAESIRIDEFCHANGIAFIKADIRGVFAQVFCDFGPSFEVLDVDGEEPHSGIVAGITPGNPTLVTTVEDERLEFQDGEEVTFSEVVGMTELNSHAPIRVKNCKAHSFYLERQCKEAHCFYLEVDSTNWNPYQRGGIVTQHKGSKTLAFKPLGQAIAEPGEFLLSDFSKLERSPLLHVGFQALDAFQAAHGGRLPEPGSEAEADELVAQAKSINDAAADKAELDEGVLRKLARTAAASLNPMAAMFGGVVGQEVVKAASGKFHPLHQWFYFDSIESLPEEPLSAEEVAPEGGRYDDNIAVFGRTLQRRMEGLKVFLVGAGALGCEFLKNFALMGTSCGEGGLLTVTDDDVIEKSNLSRQFLFRDWNIGSSKSSCASEAAQRINPAIKINALQNRVSPETEDVFNDGFWDRLDVVVNALDNVNARLYVDSRCVYFCKPLLESGTLGPKCNTQMVVPRLTENYGASRDPPEKQAPMCTLHSFPHNIHHCLTYARSEFEGILEKTPAEANAFLADPEKYISSAKQSSDAAAREQLEKVVEVLVTERCGSFEECVAWARRKFQQQFYDRIAQLVYTFPEDAKTSTGALFWSPPKRFPSPVVFSAADPSHAAFIQAAAILKAQVYGLPVPDWAADTQRVVQVAAAVEVQPFQPKENVKIETDPKASAQSMDAGAHEDQVIDELINKLRGALTALPQGSQLSAISFEKDDDTNYHMQFIAGFANMRARNYAIPEVDKLQAKLIAGRIIPAIATTTAMATGLVCLELYKVIQNKPVEAYRNTFANLALPLFAMAEPIPPKSFKFNDLEWSLWDRWILEGDLTVNQVLEWFRAKGLEAYSISCGQSLLYNNIFPKHKVLWLLHNNIFPKHKERLDKKMSELVQTVAKMEIPADRSHFDVVVACEDEEGEDLDVPLVSINRRLEGYTADLAALNAIDGGKGDAEAALQGAVNNRTVSSGVRGVRWIPAVDRETGIFTMYLVLFKDGQVLDVNRHMGAALGQADGSVLLTDCC
ncbi:Ubiquitin-activating enzyme E1 2 isoform A [Chlorella sorokiniana]|uniref:E1 ubiquitin-activating enzyme n=1 Tax=Chlorella sorokiniana TaxID=3076 RepID=A0A2P6TDH5_CHLSO|nr:Ubiquitin-activating enzyme E1 2 isoform A [Chlorella sorokiniana]|eukprot:PRW20689.1 Ubiquitin-activating enzyme E1 2 isoform A [Chlorella sorokiniana]